MKKIYKLLVLFLILPYVLHSVPSVWSVVLFCEVKRNGKLEVSHCHYCKIVRVASSKLEDGTYYCAWQLFLPLFLVWEGRVETVY